MKTKHIQHLYWRAGFGIGPKEESLLISKSRKQIVNDLFNNSKSIPPLELDTSELVAFYSLNQGEMSRANRMEAQKMNRRKITEYNYVWIERLCDSDQLLRERMHLFWTNHFVCRDRNIFHYQRYNNTMRKHALGNFGDFVKAISRETSMLKYLNNKQNVKQKPNENFGRELLELFTLGIGNYTEKDIKEASRAFTGWNHKLNGDFRIVDKRHDFGTKTFMGHSGEFGGDDIVDVILKQKQCARFICTKIYREFVSHTIDEDRVEELTNIFYKNYSIEELMRHLFMSNWFYDEENIGVKIKSPIDLLVGMYKTVPFKFEKNRAFTFYQKELGQELVDPPNVAGWPGGTSWIDSNSMLLRLKLPSMLLNDSVIALDERGEFEDSYEKYYSRMKNRKKYIKVTADWSRFDEEFKDVSLTQIPDYIIQSSLTAGVNTMISNLKLEDKHDYCVQLMSVPEYQMC